MNYYGDFSNKILILIGTFVQSDNNEITWMCRLIDLLKKCIPK
jgi:hypothetical protein